MIVDRLGGADMEALRARGTMPVPMKVPPHLEREGSMMAYPLALPTGPLDELAPAGSTDQAAMVQCLSDGPPQHALANAAMIWLLGAALDRLDGRASDSARPSTRSRKRSSPPPKR
jgi:hypothetical protein